MVINCTWYSSSYLNLLLIYFSVITKYIAKAPVATYGYTQYHYLGPLILKKKQI